jgi:type IV pilus assembly protein PilY1
MRSRRVRKPIATLLYSVLLTSPLGVCAGPVAQSPLFVSPPVPADVVFLLDDSGSMNTYNLPMPKGIDLSRYGALATFADGSTYPVSYWLQESPVLNPLWYNPAITYLPWNNDNGTATFPNADFGGRSQVADLSHLTQQDMRYVVANGSRVRVNPGTGTIGPDSDLDVPLPASIIKTLNLSASATAHYPLMALGSEPSGADLFSRVPASTQAACRIALPCPSYITPPPVFDPATETISQGAPYCSQTPSCPTQDVYFVTAPPSGAPAGYFLWDGVPGTSNDSTHYTPVEVARYKGSATARANASANVTGNVYAPRDTNGQRVSRSDCVTNRATTGTCTFTEEAQNFANWYTYYRTRLFAAIAVTSQAMSTFNDADHSALRVGYGQINYFTGQPSPWDPNAASSNLAPPTSIDGAATAGALVRGVRPFTPQSTDRQQVFDWLFGLSAYGQTPSREALDAIGRYYTRSDTAGPWGDTPGSSTSQTISAASASTSSLNGCRRAYTILTTDGEWTSGNANDPSSRQPILGVSAATPGTAVPGLDTAGATPLSSVTVANATTISGAGADVDRTFVYKPVAFPDVTPASIGPNSANGDSNPPGNTDKTLTSVAMYYWNRDLLPKTPNALQIGDGSTDPAFWQHMSTFAVAYGLSAPEDTPANRAIVSTNNAAIAAGSSSTASINWPAVDTSTGLETGGNRIDDVFRATMASGGNFYSAANPQQLAGDIASAFAQFATVTASGTSVGAPGVNVFAGNQVFTASFKTQVWTGSVNAYEAASYVNALAANQIPTPQWSASIPTRRTLLTTTDPTSGTRAFSSSTPALLQRFGGNSTLINYLLGDRSLEGNPYRVRAGLLGDIVDSSPYYSGIIDYGYAAQPAGNGGGSIYTAYLAKIATRAPMVYAGANDGIWHAFAAKDGQEIFGYVPRAVLPTNTSGTDGIASLAASSYVHQFFVDGPTTESDVWSPSAHSWSRVAVGSDGAGPASLFAFDTTYLQYGGANTVKWEITGTENSSLGHNPGAGVIGSSRNALPGGASSFIYVNGNGFDSAQGTASLLVIDAAQGSVLRQIVVDSNSGSGLGPVSVIYDAARNITTAYAGDLKGQLWKFDLSASTASNWKVANNGKPIFRATQGPPYQPITVAPRLSVNASGGYSISFGSGKLFEIGDNTNVDAQAIYSIVDNNGGGVTITPSQLTQLSLSSNGNGGYNIVTPATVSALGFALKLTALPGERIIRPAVINGGQVDFTSYAPSDPAGTLCGPSAASLFYQLSLATGTGVASPVAGSVGGYTLLQLQPANSGSASASGSTPLSNSPAVGILPSAWSSSSAATRKCVGAGTSVSATNTSSNPQCPSVPLLRVWRQPLRTP